MCPSPKMAPLPVTTIEARQGWLNINLAELWQFRELLMFFIWRDIKVRYKQTVLGVTWAVLQPLVKMLVFTFVFGTMAKMDSEGVPYAVFVFAGLLPWGFFSSSLTRSSQSIVGQGNLIKKVYFPRLLSPLASVGSGLVDFAISFVILFGVMLYYSTPVRLSILAVIPLVFLTVLVALGVGTFLSALNTAYRDFRHIVPFLVQIWMFLTPVIYSVTLVPEKWRWLLVLNPMTGIVDGYRAAIFGKPFDWMSLGVSAGLSVLLLFCGVLYFRRIERYFADII